MHLSEGSLLQSLLSSTSAASIDSGNKEGDTQTTNSLSEGPSPLLIAQEYSDPVAAQAAKVCTVAPLPANHGYFSVVLHPWASSGCPFSGPGTSCTIHAMRMFALFVVCSVKLQSGCVHACLTTCVWLLCLLARD